MRARFLAPMLTVLVIAGCAQPEVLPPESPPDPETFRNDYDILPYLSAVLSGEQAVAELAEREASSPEVRRYAADLGRRLGEVAQRAHERWPMVMVSDREPTGPPSTPSDVLSRHYRDTQATLAAHEGDTFDRAFLESQLRTQDAVATTLDDLIGMSRVRDLRRLMGDTRDVLMDTRPEAERLLANQP